MHARKITGEIMMRMFLTIPCVALILGCSAPEISVVNRDLPRSYQDPVRYFHESAERGDIIAVMRCLEERLVQVNARDDFGWTACMYAARAGREAVIEYLLTKRADLNAADPRGESALTLAIDNAHQSTASFLIESGAAVGAHGGRIRKRWKNCRIF